MYRSLLILGVALVGVGLVLSLVPLFSGPAEVLTARTPDAAFNATTPFSLTGTWTIGLTWTSSHLVSLLVVVCHSINLSAGSLQTICPGRALTTLNGTSGSATFSVPVGGALLVGIISSLSPNTTVNVQLRPTLVLVGSALVIGGAGVAIVGLLLPRRPPSAVPVSISPAGIRRSRAVTRSE